ncbi:hypothetical protein CKO28_13810 [Rhodovibrio sodomensis]|uniref:Uncharacterized protein n=1 Tax=Rhodovibrio sodomensis TaxID=1088 RepID=A0ABS1DIA0_9PROT|nr:hypothetical protein [Rhodovibrio sodomensis]MBK1669110.1 hypothetical protein [Rhodovibrio sodomensis]
MTRPLGPAHADLRALSRQASRDPALRRALLDDLARAPHAARRNALILSLEGRLLKADLPGYIRVFGRLTAGLFGIAAARSLLALYLRSVPGAVEVAWTRLIRLPEDQDWPARRYLRLLLICRMAGWNRI